MDVIRFYKIALASNDMFPQNKISFQKNKDLLLLKLFIYLQLMHIFASESNVQIGITGMC